MIVDAVPVSDLIQTNAYFYIDEQTKHGFLIDPGSEPEKLLEIIRKNNWIIEKILLTHGHFDHIGGVEKIHQELNVPYFSHQNGKNYLLNPEYNLSAFFINEIKLHEAQYLDENDEIVLEADPSVKLRVIYTPGHTQDSVIYYDADNKLAFVGDTIFKNSVGRTDIPGGNERQIYQSIREKIFTLPDDTILYSGHSEPTTVGAEKP